ncbi:MAG: hypothetical protein ABIP36_04090 [Acidimicrobiales bacterium]
MKRRLRIGTVTLVALLTVGSAHLAASPSAQHPWSPVAFRPSVDQDPTATSAPGEALDRLKRLGATAIGQRLDSLGALRGSLTRAIGVSDTDRAALLDDIAATVAGLEAVRTAIAAGTTFRTVSDAVANIVDGYRAYSVLVPKVHLVIGAGLVDQAADVLDDANAQLVSLVDDEAARELLATSSAAVARARAAVAALASSVLDLDATGWPGNEVALDDGKRALVSARSDLGDALGSTAEVASSVEIATG